MGGAACAPASPPATALSLASNSRKLWEEDHDPARREGCPRRCDGHGRARCRCGGKARRPSASRSRAGAPRGRRSPASAPSRARASATLSSPAPTFSSVLLPHTPATHGIINADLLSKLAGDGASASLPHQCRRGGLQIENDICRPSMPARSRAFARRLREGAFARLPRRSGRIRGLSVAA